MRHTKCMISTPGPSGLLYCNVSPRAAANFVTLLLVTLTLCLTTVEAQLRVVCWGNPNDGVTNVPVNLTNIRSIAAGYNHCLALLSNGTVVAWGNNDAGQTNGHVSLTNIMAIAAGQYHNVALRSNGTVFAWGGYNNNGELNIPAGLASVKAIAAGGSHSLALRSNGTVVAWGRNFDLQTNVPPGLTSVAAIAAGDTHSMALRSNGTIVVWGDNNSGQLNIPAGLTNVIAFAAGYHHNLAVRSNGTVAAWELNVYGETTVPPGLSNVFAVAAGYFSSVALRSNGTVVAWGQNFSGQTNVPPGLTNVIAIVAGSEHVMALTPSPVCSPALPDNFECRQPLVGTSLAFVASNFGATYESGELPHYFTTGSNSIWYTWTAPFSGGLVFQTSFAGVLKPIVAVYSGTSLTNLVKLVANSTVGNNSGGAPVARAVLTVVGGQNYQIVVDSLVAEYLTNTLTLLPPPANDLFANATVINGIYFQASGSFVGADREAGEPAHGNPSLGQTLWWRWTAPTNGPNPLSVRLMTDAVSFPPAVGVYTGNVVSGLSAVTLTTATNGMTSDVIFNATPGGTYHIALAGRQSEPDSVSPLIGNFRIRLNTRVLALSITNLTTSTNGSEVAFQAHARIQNLGTNKTAPLRVSLSVISGQSTVQPLATPPASISTNLSIINVTNSLGPNQSLLIPISGVAPAATFEQFNAPVAYGVYADLQEQPVTNKWFTVDQTLVTYDKWPGIGEIFGPGGGVIRFDPGYTVAPFSPITAMAILGSLAIPEGRATNYSGWVTFADATTQIVTNTDWSVSQFTISTNGVFTGGSVTSNTLVTLTLPYYFAGLTFITTTNITVLNLPAPAITNLSLLGNAGIVFTLNGVPGRSNVIEAATNLAPPAFWLPLATNAPASGVFTFTNFPRTNFPIRFYRAREQ